MPTYSTGRLTAVCYGGATSSAGSYQSYDQLGRVNVSYQQTAASKGKGLPEAHAFANLFFGGLRAPTPSSKGIFDANGTHLTGVTAEYPVIGKSSVNAKITMTFVSPIPVAAIAKTPSGSQRVHVVNVEKTP